MSINIGPPSVEELRPRITVIGVGGAGGNAIANMIAAQIEGVDFIVANTDAQALNNSISEHRIQLGPDITQGLGAGSRPEVGRAAAEETISELERALEGVNMVFIAAGMGGGTGTGAAPVIAEVARRMGVLTVGVVTKPFLFEGTRRMRSAEAGIAELQKHVDTLIVIPNQNLFLVAKADTTFKEAFQLADEVLQQGVRSITDLMVMPGLINLDFADVRSVMGEMGKAMMGTGEGEGENRALEAAERAIANPLLDGVSMQGARGVIISIIGGDDMRLLEVDEAANHIRELVDPEANIIWGSAFNPDLNGRIRVSVVATGIEHQEGQGAAERDIARPLAMSTGRAPKKPALPLPGEDELEEVSSYGSSAEPEPVAETAWQDETGNDDGAAPRIPVGMHDPAAEAYEASLELEGEGEEDEDEDASSSRYGSMLPPDLADEAGGDKNEGEEAFELTSELEDANAEQQSGVGSSGGDELWNDRAPATASEDGLFAEADRLAEEDAPVAPAQTGRRRGILGGLSGDSGDSGEEASASRRGSTPGATLFERMANLSRGSASDEDDEDEVKSGSSLNIPRFLGRQNNQ